jgi:hypothetical protein
MCNEFVGASKQRFLTPSFCHFLLAQKVTKKGSRE